MAQAFVWYAEIAESPGITVEEEEDGVDGGRENHESEETGNEAQVIYGPPDACPHARQ